MLNNCFSISDNSLQLAIGFLLTMLSAMTKILLPRSVITSLRLSCKSISWACNKVIDYIQTKVYFLAKLLTCCVFDEFFMSLTQVCPRPIAASLLKKTCSITLFNPLLRAAFWSGENVPLICR